MANPIENSYNYMGEDIDQDLLLQNLEHNVGGYIGAQGWDEARREDFVNSYRQYLQALNEGRLSSGSMGDINDSAGVLDNGETRYVVGRRRNVLTQPQYDRRRRPIQKRRAEKYSPNRDVATYIDSIARALYDDSKKKKTEKTTTKFDFDKYGLEANFKKDLSPNGNYDPEAWISLDDIDPETGYLQTLNREKAFSDFINRYRAALDPELDYADTYGSKDIYYGYLQQLQDQLANGESDEAYRTMLKLGISPEFYKEYFSKGEGKRGWGDLNPAQLKRMQDIVTGVGDKYIESGYTIYTPSTVRDIQYNKDDPNSLLKNLNAANINISPGNLRNTTGEDLAPYMRALDGAMEEGAFKEVSSGDYAGWRYIPESLNKNDYSILAYDPQTNKVARLYYPTLGDEEYEQTLESILRDNVAAIGGEEVSELYRPFTLQNGGGLVTMYQTGGSATADDEDEDDAYDEAAYGNYMASQQPTATPFANLARNMGQSSSETIHDHKLSRPMHEGNNYNDNTWSSSDIARTTGLIADIGAMVYPGMVGSAVMGVGSDVANLYADLKDGYSLRQSLGRFGAGLAMSAIGVIPIFGQIAGSGSKVMKSLMRLAPRAKKIVTWASGAGLLANGDAILESFSKIGKSGEENKMNMQDWKNILMAFQFISHGFRGRRLGSKANNMLERNRNNTTIDVAVKNKTTGNNEILRFGKQSDVEALKNAKSVKDVEAVMNNYSSFSPKQYEVLSNTQKGRWSWSLKKVDGKRNWLPTRSKTEIPQVLTSYNIGRWPGHSGLDKDYFGFLKSIETSPGRPMQNNYWINVKKAGGVLSPDERVRNILKRRKRGTLERPFELGPYKYQDGGQMGSKAFTRDWTGNYMGQHVSNFSDMSNTGSIFAYNLQSPIGGSTQTTNKSSGNSTWTLADGDVQLRNMNEAWTNTGEQLGILSNGSGITNTNLGGSGNLGGDETETFGDKLREGMKNFKSPGLYDEIQLGRALRFNNQLKKYPHTPFLTSPLRYNNAIEGDNAAMQSAREMAGKASSAYSNIASSTSDAAQAAAIRMQGQNKANEYLSAGRNTDNTAIKTSRANALTIEHQNQSLALQNSQQNAANIYKMQQEKLLNDAQRDRMKYESISNYLKAKHKVKKTKEEENDAYRQYYSQQDMFYGIASDLSTYGISMNSADQALIDRYFENDADTADFTSDDAKRLKQILTKVQEEYERQDAAKHGITYSGYRTRGGTSTFSPNLIVATSSEDEGSPVQHAKGGKLSDEKKAELEYKKKLAVLEAREKRLRAQMDRYEKDMNRLERTSRASIKSQTRGM